MHTYLEEIGVWKSVVIGYTPPNKVKTSTQKEAKKNEINVGHTRNTERGGVNLCVQSLLLFQLL